jgi:AraC-like DNA-binding protein
MVEARSLDVGSTVSVLGLRVLVSYAKECGVNVAALFEELGVAPAALDDDDNRLPVRFARRVWELAAQRSGDPSFGLHAAERATVGCFEAMDYVLWASSTLGEIMDRMQRYHRVIADDFDMHVVRSGRWVRMRRVFADRRHRAESGFALIALRARELCGRAFRLHEVRFIHHAPADVRPHRAMFRCPVRFGAPVHEIVLEAEQMKLPVRTAKPGLARVLDRHLKDLISKLPKGQTYLQRVDDAVARTLYQGKPSLAATARALHASPRTVQRNLQELGLTHRQVVDDVRREMAERLLTTRRMSITEVAFLLGFDDVSGFRRAYRKWTGTNPSRGRTY